MFAYGQDQPRVETSSRLRSTFLVVLCGSLLALLAVLARVGAAEGVSASQMAFITSAGAGLLLLAVNLRQGSPPPFDRRHIVAYLALGAVSFALPNVLRFVVAVQLGAGFASALSAATPLLTLAGAAAIGQERLRVASMVGLSLGSVGALLLLGAATLDVPHDIIWLLMAALVPMANAAGNILRGVVLPERASTSVISGVLLTAALMLAPPALSRSRTAAGVVRPFPSLPHRSSSRCCSRSASFGSRARPGL